MDNLCEALRPAYNVVHNCATVDIQCNKLSTAVGRPVNLPGGTILARFLFQKRYNNYGHASCSGTREAAGGRWVFDFLHSSDKPTHISISVGIGDTDTRPIPAILADTDTGYWYRSNPTKNPWLGKGFSIFIGCRCPGAELHHRAKFRQNPPIHCGDIAIFRFFKMAAVCHLGFVWGLFGPPTKGTWWSLSLYKIWLQSMQYFQKYESLNFSHIWLENAYSCPQIGVFGNLTP